MSGDYFIYITDDDYWPDNNFLKKCVDIFKKYSTVSSVIGSQLSEFYDEAKTLKFRNILDIQNIIDNNQLNRFNMYFHKDLFETGFLTGKQYLNKFSENSTSINISVTGTVRRKKFCDEINYLVSKNPSKWQGGYELISRQLFHMTYTLLMNLALLLELLKKMQVLDLRDLIIIWIVFYQLIMLFFKLKKIIFILKKNL